MIYTLTLNPSLDLYMDASPAFGKIVRSSGERIAFGGKGINVSRVLKTLGIKSTALGFVGSFTGDALMSALDEYGIIHKFTKIDGMTRINVKMRSEVETDINACGPEISDDDVSRLLDEIRCLTSDDMLVICGSRGRVGEDIYEKIFDALDDDVTVYADVSGGDIKYVCSRAALVKPNYDELAEFCGFYPKNKDDIAMALSILHKSGARGILLSLGEDGAMLSKGSRIYSVNAPKIEVVNTVCAGDSMLAGFIAEGSNNLNSLRFAVACGSAAAACEGLPRCDEIEKMLSDML